MKLAVICGGRTYKKDPTEKIQLRFVNESVRRVKETLESQGWKTESLIAKTTKAYTDVLQNYKGMNVDEYLFYFIGHGFSSNSVEFEIFLEENELTIKQLINATKSLLGTTYKNISLVY